MIKRIFGCVGQYKKYAFITPLLMVGEVCCECIIPLLTASLINKIQSGCEMADLWRIGGALLAMALLSLSFGAAAGWVAAKASSGFAANLRKELFYRVQGFSFSNIDRFSTSSLVTRLTTDVTHVERAFMMIIRVAVRAPLMLVFAVIMSVKMGGKLAWIFALTIPFLFSGLALMIYKAMPLFRAVFKKYDNLNNSIQENVQAMRVVKSFVRENYEKEKFGKASAEVRNDFLKAEVILAFNNPLMQACMYTSMILISYFAARAIIRVKGVGMGVGTLASMITYSVQILMSLMMLSMIFVMMTLSITAMKRIYEVLEEKVDLQNPEEPVMQVADGSVDFENVSFKYSAKAERMALDGINLHIDAGMTVGIIGGTGSSKSSLVQLICRLYDVTEGTVKVGGLDVRNYDLQALRDSVAVVLQKNVLFSGTIAENLRWGNKDATDEELVRICRLAQADEFIQQFPDGYNTYIEQGGTNVSGGQKQRLCIARALLKKPKILILDDSTSAVDTKTDSKIRKAFATEIPDTTKIIIAQRISSVQEADLILVMENGTVCDQGTHDELLKTSEIYRQVYESQTKGGDEE